MSNAVVRYNNGFNTVPLRKFSPVEMDLFWSICSKMKRKGTDELTFDFESFKSIANYDRREKESFYFALKSTWEKMKSLSYKFEDSTYFEDLVLFQRFVIDKENEKVILQASNRFEFILNNISKNFTRFELETMTKLSSTYTKELYRQLMAHKDLSDGTGAWYVKVDDFRKVLSIPDSYRMSDIDRQIFNTAKKEFTLVQENGRPLFEYFRVEKVKAKKGNRISSFKIYFKEHRLNISMHNWLNEDE
ncbi:MULTISPECIES: replication initiation protein [Enterococcus]|jgi:plasmid replication initiation protein|nr:MULTISPECIES: replication initiation protein [Enterococcus]EGP4986440.1 replication initiation protein [Enterococcus faecium]EMF0409003.1 replication initiation protein [Enterococcus faecium]MCM6879938.1 replication initiation protein [Enterococcus faecium]PQG46958.1 initiator RepB protein [Enterococcus faecium]ROX73542.1 RepB family plasmid replication initiator protein [Enterococcus faecium]